MNFFKSTKLGFLVLSFLLIVFFPGLSKVLAVTDGSFRLIAPGSGNLIATCSYALDIRINTGNNNSNSADIIIDYDPAKIEILDSNTGVTGKQIKSGTAYQSYFGNQVDESNGRIRLTGATFNANFRGEALFGTIEFKSKPGVTNASFTIKFDGPSATNTLDSNIAITENSLDALGSVTNANLNFAPGSCLADTIAPNINFINPSNNQSNVPTNQTITINITDNLSGVNLNSLEILVNGVLFTSASPEVTITGNPNNYTVTITNNNLFYPDDPSSIAVKVRDYAGNQRQSNISFNFPPAPITPTPPTVTPNPSPNPTPTPNEDNIPPTIDFINPISRITIPDDSSVIIKIGDNQSGVKIDSLIIVINEKRYTINDTNVQYEGTPQSYTIKITDDFNFSKISASYLSVYVSDFANNVSSDNLVFNISKIIVDETDRRNQGLVCTPDDSKPNDVVSNPPFKETVRDIQSNVEDAVPNIVKPIVEETGVFGIASIIAALPLLVWLGSLLFSFIAGGLALPFFRNLFFIKKKRFGLVIDAEDRKGIKYVQINIFKKENGELVTKILSSFRGKFFVELDPGNYVFKCVKKGYEDREYEISVAAGQVGIIQNIIDLASLDLRDDIGSRIQMGSFNINPLALSMYFALFLSVLNVLYIRTLFAVVMFVVILLFAIFSPKKVKALRTSKMES